MTRFRVRRGAVVAVLLVLAFGVAAALAVQAYRTAGDHRAQADRVLRDYARLAAARVAIRTATDIYYAVSPPLKALQHAHETAPHKAPPKPKDLHFDTMEHEFSIAPYIRFTFWMDLKNKHLQTSGQELPGRPQMAGRYATSAHPHGVRHVVAHGDGARPTRRRPAVCRLHRAARQRRDAPHRARLRGEAHRAYATRRAGDRHAEVRAAAAPAHRRHTIRFDGVDHHHRSLRRRDLSLRRAIQFPIYRTRHDRHRHGRSLRAGSVA